MPIVGFFANNYTQSHTDFEMSIDWAFVGACTGVRHTRHKAKKSR